MYKYICYGTLGAISGSFLFKKCCNHFESFDVKSYNNLGLYLGLGLGSIYAYKNK